MSIQPQIWICAAHHPAFRCGGWASLRLDQGLAAGAAGGERNTTAQRMALAGLVWALRGLAASPRQPVENIIRIQTTSPDLASLGEVLAGRAQPEQDLDLWAEILTASKTHRLGLFRVALQPDTPVAFAAAWANLAMDKAKASGPFSSAIPRSNLAKAPGLGA